MVERMVSSFANSVVGVDGEGGVFVVGARPHDGAVLVGQVDRLRHGREVAAALEDGIEAPAVGELAAGGHQVFLERVDGPVGARTSQP